MCHTSVETAAVLQSLFYTVQMEKIVIDIFIFIRTYIILMLK